MGEDRCDTGMGIGGLTVRMLLYDVRTGYHWHR